MFTTFVHASFLFDPILDGLLDFSDLGTRVPVREMFRSHAVTRLLVLQSSPDRLWELISEPGSTMPFGPTLSPQHIVPRQPPRTSLT